MADEKTVEAATDEKVLVDVGGGKLVDPATPSGKPFDDPTIDEVERARAETAVDTEYVGELHEPGSERWWDVVATQQQHDERDADAEKLNDEEWTAKYGSYARPAKKAAAKTPDKK